MVSRSEDELLDTLVWSDDSYLLAEFLTEFPLPQVVKIVRGHDGTMTNSPTLGFGEVLTFHALRESRTLAGEDKNGGEIAIELNYPDEFQILPQASDCPLDSCGVTDLATFYQTIKYLEVIQAHYGTGDDLDTTAQGELLEIQDIIKPQKPDKAKVNVRNLQSEQNATLTYTCTARFRPLLDWKKYKARDLKTHQYGFPIRVRFSENADWIREDMECQRLISKSPTVNITDETEDITVIGTTVASDRELKFCYEIPKSLEIKVAVAEGFSSGSKPYTNVVNDLNERFDVAKFITSFQPTMIRRRNAVRQYNYDTIKDCVVRKYRNSVLEVEQASDAPALPPRRHVNLGSSKSVNMPPAPPKPKPAVPLRAKSESHNLYDNVNFPPGGEDDTVTSSGDSPQPQDEVNNPNGPGDRRVKPPINTPPTPKAYNNIPNDPPKPKAREIKPPVKPPINTPNSPPVDPAETINGHKDPADMKSSKQPVELPKPAPNSVQTIKNKPISPLVAELKSRVKIPIPHPRSQTPGTNPKPQEIVTNDPTDKPLTKALDETDAPEVEAEQTTAKSSPSPPHTDVKANLQNCEPAVASPKLPPRQGRPKLHQKPNDNQAWVTTVKDVPTTNHSEERQEQHGTDYIPDLPPKSPKWTRRYPLENPNYVVPIQPNVSSNYPPSSVVPPEVPSSPRPGGRTKKRADTLPTKFKFGQNASFGGPQTEIEESLYEEPFQRPVVKSAVSESLTTSTKLPVHEENPYDLVAKIPFDLSALSIGEVANLLKNLNMAEYAERFENEMIDGRLLKEMKESQLTDLEMTSFHRTKLLNFINGWRPKLAADKSKI